MSKIPNPVHNMPGDAPQLRDCLLLRAERLPLPDADAEMRRLQQLRLADVICDALIFVEHPEIVTLGRRAQVDNIAPPPGYASFPLDRGGGITWHGPGQLTIYPVFAWRGEPKLPGDRNIGRITDLLEEWIIRGLARLGVTANRDNRMRGAWVGEHKIASIGLAFSRWVSRHGLTINYDTPPARVENLSCCGLADGTTTSIAAATGTRLRRTDLEATLLEELAPVLGRKLIGRMQAKESGPSSGIHWEMENARQPSFGFELNELLAGE
ncbi:MAG: lipoyl(octanoyl) transferase LipB [Pirellulales bacterium]|nr:lipoyl(octanoyl) transferase LipB [Pirellulales bacterium]